MLLAHDLRNSDNPVDMVTTRLPVCATAWQQERDRNADHDLGEDDH
jgi:hypothetical protein